MKRRCLLITALVLALLLSHLNKASCSEPDLSKIPVPVSKLNFLTLYKTQWELFGMNPKLTQAVNDAFDEQTESLMWGTKGIQLASNYDNILEKIQQSTEYKFSQAYDKFLSELEITWGEKLREDILSFYKRQNEELYFELDNNPMVQAYLRQDYDRVTQDKGLEVMKKVSAGLSDKYPSLELTGAKAVGGSMMLFARKYLTAKVRNTLARKLTGTALGKIAGAAVPVIGWAMLAWSAYDLYSMAVEAEDTIKDKLYTSYNTMYSDEVPLVYWEGMESYVRDAYIFAYEQLLSNVKKGLSLEENPKIKQLKAGMNKSDERFFSDRIAVIHEVVSGKSYSLDDVLDAFGEYIRDCSFKDFDRFAASLLESDGLPATGD